MGDAGIFRKTGKRLLDPYAKREIPVYLDKPSSLASSTARLSPPAFRLPDMCEPSPLDAFVEQIQKDLRIQDNIKFVERQANPELSVDERAPEVVNESRVALKPIVEEISDELPAADLSDVEPPAPSTPAPSTPEPRSTAWTHEKFWAWIGRIGWTDRTDGNPTMRGRQAIRALSPSARTEMMKVYTTLFESMKDNLDQFLSGYDMSDANRNSLISHVIAKGEEFYVAAVADPEFVGYLISDANASASHNEFVDFGELLA